MHTSRFNDLTRFAQELDPQRKRARNAGALATQRSSTITWYRQALDYYWVPIADWGAAWAPL